MEKKLRIGLLLNSYMIPAWTYKMLEEIKNHAGSEIVLIVKNKPAVVRKKGILERIKNNRHRLYRIYRRYDKRKNKCFPDAFEPRDIDILLSVDTIEVVPDMTRFSDRIRDSDLAEIKKYNIDIFIRLGFRILRGGILKAAKYGVWSYHHGDNKVNRGVPPGFWEVIENWDETGVVLQILNENLDGGTILFKSYARTDKRSVNRNVNNYYWKALSFLPAKIRELYETGEEEFFKKVDELNSLPLFYSNRLYTAPTNGEMLLYLLKRVRNKIANEIRNCFYFEQWILLYDYNAANTFSTSFFRFKEMIPPKDRLWADPFVIKKADNYFIFIEELIFTEKKGHISVIKMDSKGNYSQPLKILERDYHMSYPFVFEDNGEFYMIPETRENNTIELYKCVHFPNQWEFVKVLLSDLKAVDSTILKYNGKYWLFGNVQRNEGASLLDELFIFYTDNLLSDTWTNHPQNPVISDVKQARPAGKFFYYKDMLYRPSQNCSKRYGYGMKINQVIELSETTYRERIIDSIYPSWDKKLLSTHTINSADGFTIIDALMQRRK
jgi:hypothetical protein